MTNTTAKTRGAHHVGLTVPDVSAAAHFFCSALGFEQVGEVADYPALFVSDGHIMLTLWQAEDAASATPFDRRKNLGLHHLALSVTDLDAAADALGERSDVELEFEPEPLGTSGLRHLMCRIPGNLRLELVQS